MGEKDKALADKPFIWLHVSVLREYLEVELHVPQQPFRFDLERALDDWVFMCFFVGNDFLPHLPSLDIRENGIDTLIAIWRDNIPLMGSYVTKDGHVDLERAQFILDGLAKQEDAIFRRRRETEQRRDANAKDESSMSKIGITIRIWEMASLVGLMGVEDRRIIAALQMVVDVVGELRIQLSLPQICLCSCLAKDR